jgi:hypothetical protein
MNPVFSQVDQPFSLAVPLGVISRVDKVGGIRSSIFDAITFKALRFFLLTPVRDTLVLVIKSSFTLSFTLKCLTPMLTVEALRTVSSISSMVWLMNRCWFIVKFEQWIFHNLFCSVVYEHILQLLSTSMVQQCERLMNRLVVHSALNDFAWVRECCCKFSNHYFAAVIESMPAKYFLLRVRLRRLRWFGHVE